MPNWRGEDASEELEVSLDEAAALLGQARDGLVTTVAELARREPAADTPQP